VTPATVVWRAPAKLNLGLEIIGRRDDGYHDIATIFQAIGLHDRITLRPGDGLELEVADPSLGGDDNLVLRALEELRRRFMPNAGASVLLEKAIPAAAGMGGASSDAAAALLAGRKFWSLPVSDHQLARLAASLGSDVPFFLLGGTALARGRGEVLAPLPTPRAWFVTLTPDVRIERKTATLYRALLPDDFSDGRRVQEQADRLRRGAPLDPALLGNAFKRPLLALRPELAEIPAMMRRHGASHVALSGAGPAHYAIFDDLEAATRCETSLRADPGVRGSVSVAAALESAPDSASTD
jgi:4-diphosphocytidyl-2-C-methyl-D-erythritol kinase